MKKNVLLLVVFMSLLFSNCSKDNPIEESEIIEKPLFNIDDIYKDTGCKPNDIKSIKTLHLFVDSIKNEKYLYGSRYTNNIESFWIAKFKNTGETVWEIINKDNTHLSYAHNPVILENGNIVIGRVTKGDDFWTIYGCSPVIIEAEKGNAKYINVYDGYNYSYVVLFGNFFFCMISQQELYLNPRAKKYSVQISNDGNIINQAEEMFVPQNNKNVAWFNTVDYVFVDESNNIQKMNILKSDALWNHSPELREFIKCNPTDISLNKDTVVVKYNLTLEENEEDFVTYKINYETGVFYSVSGTNDKITNILIDGIYDYMGISQYPLWDFDNLELFHENKLMAKIRFKPVYASNKKISWTCSDKNIATVNDDGIFSITSDTNIRGKVYITATSEEGGYTATLGITVDDVYLRAQGASLIQSGEKTTITFTSRITTSFEKKINIGSIYITDSNDQLIQIVSNIQNSGYFVTAISEPISIVDYSGQSLINYLSTWKFIYTYMLTGDFEYKTKEVFIKANIWGYF